MAFAHLELMLMSPWLAPIPLAILGGGMYAVLLYLGITLYRHLQHGQWKEAESGHPPAASATLRSQSGQPSSSHVPGHGGYGKPTS